MGCWHHCQTKDNSRQPVHETGTGAHSGGEVSRPGSPHTRRINLRCGAGQGHSRAP
jgi:hypothetical protein